MEIRAICLTPVLVLLVCFGSVCAGDKAFQEHLKRIHEYSCGTPRRVAVPLSEIYNVTKFGTDKKFHPPVTVLHRCDFASGCCLNSSMSCAPEKTQLVKLVFYVIPATNHESQGTPEKLIVDAFNHTICSCQSTIDSPK